MNLSLWRTAAIRAAAVKVMMTFFLSGLVFSSMAQFSLVRDINTKLGNGNSRRYTNLTVAGASLFFVVDGTELWRTPLTSSTAQLVRKFDAVDQLINLNGVLFFAGSTAAYGTEIWKSSGTPSSTVLVKNIRADSESSAPASLTVVGNQLFFSAHDGVSGRELWKTDGTNTGTVRVKDIVRVVGSSNPASLVEVNGLLYFVANDGIHGYEVWKSDGTSDGTQIVKDIRGGSSSPKELVDVNNVLFFSAINDAVGARTLYKSDGTEIGTSVVSLTPLDPQLLTNVNGVLFFSGREAIHGRELWKSDGTEDGTLLVKDLTPGPASDSGPGVPHISYLTPAGDKVYFLACAPHSQTLLVSDGTESGTKQLVGGDVSFTWINPNIIPFGANVYLLANAFYEYISMLRTDGTPAEVFIQEFDDLWDYNPDPVVANNYLYFVRRGNIWKTDGVNLILIRSPYTFTADSNPAEKTIANGKMYFNAHDGLYNGLWRSDGTKEGTVLIRHFAAPVRMLTASGNFIYYLAKQISSTSETYVKLWRTDLLTGDTRVLTNINTIGDDQISDMVDVGGTLFFGVLSQAGQPQLWKTQGSLINTRFVRYFRSRWLPIRHMEALGNNVILSASDDYGLTDALWRCNADNVSEKLMSLKPQASLPAIIESVSAEGQAFFISNNAYDVELVRTDGTAAGTTRIDIHQDDSDVRDLGGLVNLDGTVYFGARSQYNSSGYSSTELWKTDGTKVGTMKVTTFPDSSLSRVADNFLIVGKTGEQVVLVLRDALSRGQVWATDGTVAGTEMLKSIDSELTLPGESVELNDALYFHATTNGIWRTDGSECGTFEMTAEGPNDLEVLNGQIFLSMRQPRVGMELFSLPEGQIQLPCVDAGIASAASLEPESISFPNPFDSEFSMQVTGPEGDLYNVVIRDMNGVVMSELKGLKFNTSYTLGRSLPPGLYMLSIDKPKQLTKRIIKTP